MQFPLKMWFTVFLMIRVTGKLPERGVSGCPGTTLSPQIHFHGGNQDLYDGFIEVERYESGWLQNSLSILYRYAQPNRKYFCYKVEETKKHNDKWREPQATEFIIPVKVTAKTRNICKKYRYRALRKARLKIHAEQKIKKLNRVRPF